MTIVLLSTYAAIDSVFFFNDAPHTEIYPLTLHAALPIYPVIGSQGSDDLGNTDESDFHNRLGSISWEKRIDTTAGTLQGGAVFVIHLDPTDGVGDMTGTAHDSNADNKPNRQLQSTSEQLGTYTLIA